MITKESIQEYVRYVANEVNPEGYMVLRITPDTEDLVRRHDPELARRFEAVRREMSALVEYCRRVTA